MYLFLQKECKKSLFLKACRNSTLQVFAKGVDADTVVLMAARASRVENQDAIDTAIVGMLADPKEVNSLMSELFLLFVIVMPFLMLHLIIGLKSGFVFVGRNLYDSHLFN